MPPNNQLINSGMQIGDDHQYLNRVYWLGCSWLENGYNYTYMSPLLPPQKENFKTNNVYNYKT